MALLDDVQAELSAAINEVVADGAPHDPLMRRSDFADLQANFALALARKLGTQPRELAANVVERLAGSTLVSGVEISGPGFVNLSLSDTALVAELADLLAGPSPFTPGDPDHHDVVVVDYSAPNVAKQMHVGHLRSTIIGDVLCRVLDHLGHHVIRRNHIGDWGTPFGMLLAQSTDEGVDSGAELDIADLTDLYQRARARFDADPAFAETSRGWVVKLQGGDPTARELWGTLVRQSARYFNEVYALLDVLLTDDDIRGESAYDAELDDVVDELTQLGLLVEHEGALCMFLDGFTNRDDEPLPLIVRKSDGGYGYAATDLAAIRRRVRDEGATRILYVVGLPQHLHLSMIFAAARAAGWLTDAHRAEHVGFGTVLGEDGKTLRTRAGAPVRLIELLNSAVEQADHEVAVRHDDWSASQREAVATAVGIGAVKFADLANDRRNDYRFDLDRMVSTVGATGPYLQYARARISSILERAATAGLDVEAAVPDRVGFETPSERALALELAHVRAALVDVATTLEPHHLCRGLLEVAGAFSSFYEQSPVLKAEPGLRELRLALCRATERVLRSGLELLGIRSPDEI